MIEGGNPFLDPVERRDPARRFRGRLAAPVTLWTAGAPDEPAGLTMSSVTIAEGRPSSILGLVNPTTDLWDALTSTGAFVVHVLGYEHRALAERFAGQVPSPGGLWLELPVEHSEWGPRLAEVPNRACCRVQDSAEIGYAHLVIGKIEWLDVGEVDEPLIFFKGRYRRFAPRGAAGH
ncbi:hypothetical protein BH24ACT26_BH24ACT26_11010 [soil metagenome]